MNSEREQRRRTSVQRGGALFLAALLLVSCGKVLGLQDGTTQAACTTDLQCAPGYGCLQNLGCRNRCIADADCGSGSRCFKAFVTTACIPVTEGCVLVDADSGASDGCPTGTHCDGSVCRTQCDSADQCAGGQECTSGSCISSDPTHEGTAGGDGGGGAPTNGGSGGGGGAGTGGVAAGGIGGAAAGSTATSGSGGVAAAGTGGVSTSGSGGEAGAPDKACEKEGGKQCSATGVPQICADGSWVDLVECAAATPTCVAGTCRACEPMSLGCSGAATRTCNADGAWGPTSNCQGGFCNGDGVCGSCATGSAKCATSSSNSTCTTDGTWTTAAACTGGFCNGAGICGVCAASSKRCASGTNYETCAGDGTWGNSTTCPGGFCNGAGVCGACVNGSKQCSSNGVQSCANGAWGAAAPCTNQACSAGACVGVCTPNTFQCQNNIGLVCNASGQWISNGSVDYCDCWAQNRFTRVSASLVLDTTTGLTWDAQMRPLANWANASTTCTNAGMRMPTYSDWTGVMQAGGTTTCQLPTAPFDQAAMPTTRADMGGTSGTTIFNLWTGTVEGGFPGYVYVIGMFPPSGGSSNTWSFTATDQAVTYSLGYRCVK